MENIKIKKYYNKMSKESQEILIKIIEDNLAFLDLRETISKETLNRVISIYFLLINYDYKNMIEFDNLNHNEKNYYT